MTDEVNAVTIKIKSAGHEELDGLLGGSDEGHYHVTAEELNYLVDRVAERNAIEEGEEEERLGLTESEYDKVSILLDTIFPDDDAVSGDALEALIAKYIKTLGVETWTFVLDDEAETVIEKKVAIWS